MSGSKGFYGLLRDARQGRILFAHKVREVLDVPASWYRFTRSLISAALTPNSCVPAHPLLLFIHLPKEKESMDDKKIAALAKKNAAKAAKSSGRKGFGKKYDKNLSDLPTDEATLKERQEHERFFKEMRKREF
jgi:hypothetical protein